jgi:hypothetical protein
MNAQTNSGHIKFFKIWVTCALHTDEKAIEDLELHLLGPAPRGTVTMAFNPTFGSFTLLKPVSHYVNELVFLVKVFRLFRLEWTFLVFGL